MACGIPHSYNDLGPQDIAGCCQGLGWRKGVLVFHFCCLSRMTERSLEGGTSCGKFSGLADERSGLQPWLL